jgi:large subunit ribosomal protein L11
MQTIKALVDAGKANAGPPLGPALGPLGVDTMAIVNEINEKTKDLEGMQIPVMVHIDKNKSFTVEVGAPLTSALIKKALGVKKAVGAVNTEVTGDLSFDQVIKITKSKYGQVVSRDLKSAVFEILGSCRSMGVTVDKKNIASVVKDLRQGVYDSKFE